MANGNGGKNWTLVLPVGALSLLGGLLLLVSKDATVALNLHVQDAEKMVVQDRKILSLEGQIQERTQDRYTAKDAQRDFRYMQRQVDECRAYIADHRKVRHEK